MALAWKEDDLATFDVERASVVALLRAAGLLKETYAALELGCRGGGLARRIAPYFVTYVGVDPDALAVESARRSIRAVRGAAVHFDRGAGVPPDSGPFDLIVCDLRRVCTGAREQRAMIEALPPALSRDGIALVDQPRRGPRLSWQEVAAAAHAAGGRIVWFDRAGCRGPLYCIGPLPPVAAA